MISLRPATPADPALLRRWDEQPHVVASDPNDDWGWETEVTRSPDWREQLIAEAEGRPIGFVPIIDSARDDTRYWGQDVPGGLLAIDIWTGDEEDLGRGYGTRIMELAPHRCFADAAVNPVLIDPLAGNPDASILRAPRLPVRGALPVRKRRLLRLPSAARGVCAAPRGGPRALTNPAQPARTSA